MVVAWLLVTALHQIYNEKEQNNMKNVSLMRKELPTELKLQVGWGL